MSLFAFLSIAIGYWFYHGLFTPWLLLRLVKDTELRDC